MQKYRPKTMLAELSDRLLRLMITSGIGVIWFVMLWGVTLPALTAGFALGGLLWLCLRQFCKRSTQKRELQMRRIIGGELALERLLLQPPHRAAFQAALWISPRFPVILEQTVDWGVTGMLRGQKVLIHLIAQHEKQLISVQQMVDALRETRKREARRCLLCLTAPATKDALSYAAAADPPICIISRDDLIELAGICTPATDEDLRKLSQRNQKRHSTQEWLAVILDAHRARRYLWYGIGLSLLAFFTRLPVYPFPAAVCLGLFLACRVKDWKRHMHSQGQSTP